MIRNNEKRLIKEYFDTTTYLYFFRLDEANCELLKRILCFMLNLCGEANGLEKYWEKIEEASCLQTIADRFLMKSSNTIELNYITDLKISMLESNKITELRTFDLDIFLNEIEEKAFLGEIHACKILACLHWLEILKPANKTVAIQIWETLAMNGDMFAIRALIYTNNVLGNKEKAQRWTDVFDLLERAQSSYLPVIFEDKYEISEESIQLANLIISMKQKNEGNRTNYLNRMMLYYALNSEESYETKMKHLSMESNYYLLLQRETKLKNKKFGF